MVLRLLVDAHSYWRSSLLLLSILIACLAKPISTKDEANEFQQSNCNLRKFGNDGDVDNLACVCDVNYCDTLQLEWPLSNNVLVVRTSLAGLRFHKTMMKEGKIKFVENFPDNETETSTKIKLHVDTNQKRQEVFGFGGSVSDSASINIKNLNYPLNRSLVRDYFGYEGLEYNFIRLPLGATDFSLRQYSYDDNLDQYRETDFKLRKFSLAYEDEQLKIPLIKAAMAEANPTKIKVLASAWTAPKWMKTNNNYVKGTLRGRPGGPYYKAYANYLVKAYEEYNKRGITFWALTVQNEPVHPLNPKVNFSSMLLTPKDQRDFIKMDLGPILSEKDLGPNNLQLIVFDDNLPLAPYYLNIVLTDDKVYSYTAGIAIHWYYNYAVPHHILTTIKRRFPDKFILSTEACEGYLPERGPPIVLGSWRRGVTYALDIMKDLKFHVNGWIDWNLALDTRGGPNYANNFVDALVIVNADSQEYYKNPGYYIMGHMSKFLPPGSRIINTELLGQGEYMQLYDDSMVTLGALTPSNHLVIIVLNNHMESRDITITVDKSYEVSVNIHANSVTSIAVANWWY